MKLTVSFWIMLLKSATFLCFYIEIGIIEDIVKFKNLT